MPFQPNVNPDGCANPAAGQDDAILYGAIVEDPGGLPKGTLQYLTFSRFYNVAGRAVRGDGAPASLGPADACRPGTVTLTVPSGWTVDAATEPVGAVGRSGERLGARSSSRRAASAAVNANYQISAALHDRAR